MEYVEKIEQIHPSNDAIRKRIYDILKVFKKYVIFSDKNSGRFGLQLDETTNVSDEAQLMAYVRYPGISKWSFVLPFNDRKYYGRRYFIFKGLIFQKRRFFLASVSQYCTDDVPSMLGVRQGSQQE